MKYKIGDKVRIRKDLRVYEMYGLRAFVFSMAKICNAHNYILTIKKVREDGIYIMEGDEVEFCWTDEMIEGLADLTDREKFEGWIRKLSSLDGSSTEWCAFNNLTMLEPNDDEYESNLRTVADYLFGVEKKKMTKTEIEAELGYEIEIVE